MRTAIVLASPGSDPRTIAATADHLAAGDLTCLVVCNDEQRSEVASLTDSPPRIVTDPVPGGGPVAAMRTGFRATRTRTAFVTTPGTPSLARGALSTLEPSSDTDVTLARVDGARRPPCGGYVVEPAREACDLTLAMGSRRVEDVLARLSVTTAAVDSMARVDATTSASTAGRN